MTLRGRLLPCLAGLPLLLATGCSKSEANDSSEVGDDGILTLDTSGSSGESSDGSGSSTGTSGGNCPPEGCLDSMQATSEGTTACGEEENCGTCSVPEHVPCDASAANDVVKAMGLNCGNGEPIVNATISGSPSASGTMAAFGTANAFPPREGTRYAVIGSGIVADLNSGGGCNGDLGAYDPGTTLPAPIVPMNVGAQTCADNPALVGTGDCSNTIQAQFEDSFASLTPGAFDYTEIRFTTTVPEGVTSFSYDFAFFSFEYPVYYGSQYNDMYIGWLESEAWTGNISFDDSGNPISLNAGFMDFLDADASGHPVCPTGSGCTAPELTGTCMDGHGGTRWLSTQASVNPGENITVVFAIMDLGDSVLDSYAFIDNFQWGCEGGMPPTTVPID